MGRELGLRDFTAEGVGSVPSQGAKILQAMRYGQKDKKHVSVCNRLGLFFCLFNCSIFIMLLLLLSHFSRVRLCATPETAAYQASLSLGFSKQEHCSGLPFPSPMQQSEK